LNYCIKEGNGELVEKKSRFIAYVTKIDSEEDALEKVNAIRKKYFDAKHHCFSYIYHPEFSDKGQTLKASDDGEPQGTAGRPMLDLLLGMNAVNTMIVVTRYFGGTLLGTGGLVRAYQGAAKEALENAEFVTLQGGYEFKAELDYSGYSTFKKLIEGCQGQIIATEYGQNVEMSAAIDTEHALDFERKVREAYAGAEIIKEKKALVYYVQSDKIYKLT